LPRPSIPRRTRPAVQATTTKITIIAMTMEVTTLPFRQSVERAWALPGEGTVLRVDTASAMRAVPVEQLLADNSAKPRSQCHHRKADSCSRFHHNCVGLHSDRPPARFASFVARQQLPQPPNTHSAASSSSRRSGRPVIVRWDCTQQAASDSPPLRSAAQATDSVSRRREEITVETPSPRMLIPYKASAISIVRF
jgi:hypothetical protein